MVKATEEEKGIVLLMSEFVSSMTNRMIQKHKQGKTGWNDIAILDELKASLPKYVERGNMVDLANVAAIIWHLENKKYGQ